MRFIGKPDAAPCPWALRQKQPVGDIAAPIMQQALTRRDQSYSWPCASTRWLVCYLASILSPLVLGMASPLGLTGGN
jgi:hypothetical protein